MATQVSRELARGFGALRFEPTPKRVRALAGGHTFADTRRALIVWEPGRIVPSYAVPGDDLHAEPTPAPRIDAEQHPVVISPGGPPVLDSRTPFAAHTCDGQPLTLSANGLVLAGAGFRPADSDLAGHVILDFGAFDEWLEEDEPIIGHPRDPFSRIDIRRTASRVQVRLDGETLADTTSARLLFETRLGTRFYLPRRDVRMGLLTPSPTRTTCAYKGEASYWSVRVGGHTHPDLAWTYELPLPDAEQIAGHICFFDEHVDVILDGQQRERPITRWS